MRMRLLSGLLFATVIHGGSVCAQELAGSGHVFEMQVAPDLVGPPPGGEPPFGIIAVEPFEMGEPIVGAPYSAEVVTEVVQELADGNRIERRSTGTVARDGRGRVRREQRFVGLSPVLTPGGAPIVTITDPAAGVHYMLDAARKVAVRSQPPTVRPARRPARDQLMVVAPPGEAHPAVRTEDLGTKQLEGVRVEGTRTVLELPAGAIGNERPIEIVSERWFSPELAVVVESTRRDPRFGQTTYRLANLLREEPAQELFQVPVGYKIEQMPPFPGKVKRRQRNEP